MTRTIKASEVKPGMTIRWEVKGITNECKVSKATFLSTDALYLRSPEGGEEYIPSDSPVTVLAEPQPEEPTEFGAKVIVDGRRFLRSPEWKADSQPWLESDKGTWRNWDGLLRLGHVKVVPDQGWTVPDAPEVPDRIEEWPENDEHLRDHEWRDYSGSIWYADKLDEWRYIKRGGTPSGAYEKPADGPWTRVPHA